MMSIEVITQGPEAWKDIQADRSRVIEVNDGPLGVMGIEDGVSPGVDAVALRVDLPNGYTVLVVTSARLLCRAADAIRERYSL